MNSDMNNNIYSNPKLGHIRPFDPTATGSLVAGLGNAPSVDGDKLERAMVREITSLLISLKGDICDDYRASDDPDDSMPGMQVTVSTRDMRSWNYQTGDNSYSGGCYGDPHWSVIYLYRRSNCKALAQDAVNELADAYIEANL